MDFNSPPLVGTKSKMKPNQLNNSQKPRRDVTANRNEERYFDDDRRQNPSRTSQEQNDSESNRNNMPNLLERPQQLDNYLQQQWLEALQRQQNLRNNEQQQQREDFMQPRFQVSQSFQRQQWDGWQAQPQGHSQQSDQYRNQAWSGMNQEQQQQQQMPFLQQAESNQNPSPFQYQSQHNWNSSNNPSNCRTEGNNLSDAAPRSAREEFQNRCRDSRYFRGGNRDLQPDHLERFGAQCAPDRNRYSPNDNTFLSNLDRYPLNVDRYQPHDERNFSNANRISPPRSRHSPAPGRHFSQPRSRSPEERHYSAIAEKYSPVRGRTARSPGAELSSSQSNDRLKSRTKFVLPGLGEPGGLDDPNRRGLSGAGVKWYLRYLQTGMQPDLARAKVDERRTSAAHAFNSSIGRGIREAGPRSPERDRYAPMRESEKSPPRRTRTTPALGQPGGPDDPNRVGLSGAGVKWYLRYLESGLAPDVAKAKVEERRKFPRPVANDENPPNPSGPSTSAQPKHKLAKRVAVLPANYPSDVLTHDELTALQEDILMEVAKGWTHKIMFDAVHFKDSMIVIDCADASTADWLAMKVPQLPKWQDRQLTTRAGTDLPLPHTITVFLPRSLGSDQTQLLTLIDAQNEGLNVASWRVLSLKEQGKGQLMVAGIDERSKSAIVRLGYSLRYRFGKVAVHGLKAANKKDKQ